MTPNIDIEIYTIDDRSEPNQVIWSGSGWTTGYRYQLERKESGEFENFKLAVRILTGTPLNLSIGQRVKVYYLGEMLLFNLVKIERSSLDSLGGFTILKLDTLP